MANADSTKSRREEARRALAGEERYATLEKKGADIIRHRREAMRAMEGEIHRKQREIKEKVAGERHASAEALMRREQLAKKAAAKTAEQKTKAEREEQVATAEAQKQRLIKITDKERTIAEIKQSASGLSPIRTYKSDFASAVKRGGISIAKIAMSERARRFNLGRAEPGEVATQNKGGVFVWLFTFILIAAVAGLSYLLWTNSQNPTPITSGPTPPAPLIFAEYNVRVILDPAADGTEVNVKSAIDAAVVKALSREPSISNFYFVKNEASLNLNAFKAVTGLKLPERLTRNVKPEFMFGAYGDGQSQSRFLILNVGAFDQVYAATLEWESSLAADILPLLYDGQQVNQVAGQRFGDKRIRNKDLRLVTDAAGQTFLLYTFLDQNTLLITTNEATFTKVFERFTNN